MATLPDLCELSDDDDDGAAGEDYVFHNPLSLLAAVPDVVDFER